MERATAKGVRKLLRASATRVCYARLLRASAKAGVLRVTTARTRVTA
jgi:hypothetical protein